MEKHNRSRLFNGPSEKRQYYIGSFIAKLSESDAQNKYFSKCELVELHSVLRKETSTNPWFFKLIQTIVDDGAFMDQSLLEMLKKEKNDREIVDYSDDEIAKFRETLDEQLQFKRLIEFNQNRIKERLSSMKRIEDNDDNHHSAKNDLDKLIQFQDYNIQTHKSFDKLVGTDEEFGIIKNSIQEIIAKFKSRIIDHNKSCDKITEKLRQELNSEIDRVLLLYLHKKSQKENVDVIEMIETNPMIKRKYLILNKILCHLKKLLDQILQNIQIYHNHKRLREDLNVIKTQMESKVRQLIEESQTKQPPKSTIMYRIQPPQEPDWYERMLKFIHENRSKFNYNVIIESLQKADAKAILLKHQLDSLVE